MTADDFAALPGRERASIHTSGREFQGRFDHIQRYAISGRKDILAARSDIKVENPNEDPYINN